MHKTTISKTDRRSIRELLYRTIHMEHGRTKFTSYNYKFIIFSYYKSCNFRYSRRQQPTLSVCLCRVNTF